MENTKEAPRVLSEEELAEVDGGFFGFSEYVKWECPKCKNIFGFPAMTFYNCMKSHIDLCKK